MVRSLSREKNIVLKNFTGGFLHSSLLGHRNYSFPIFPNKNKCSSYMTSFYFENTLKSLRLPVVM